VYIICHHKMVGRGARNIDLHGYPPNTPHLFISFAVAFSPIGLFWSVCECICAEYPRPVGILTSDDGRKLRDVDT
jgi:hypothetical protein